jgi:hypothetical protein
MVFLSLPENHLTHNGLVHGGPINHQTQINKHQQELDEVQLKIRNAEFDVANQQTNISQQYLQISMVQSDLASAQTNLDSQQKKISDVEYLVDNIFSKMTTETIRGDDTNRVCRIHTHGMVFFKLDGVPIHNSAHIVEMKSGAGNTPLILNQIQILNVISFNFGGSWDDWKDGEFNIEYVKDIRQTNTIQFIETTTNELILDHSVHVPFN